ncbi:MULTISPECIES: PLP-dependent aminotransferase family protein [unclassified Paenibacillus]|uniref:MocR-like pyridoxine biosynthesis transcription factor PdxR n=1 Tax=unclassified Paenibacillus TaxID=185978 RepID=UPI0010529294|nr:MULTISPECIES: PLP-dependent aminotransferase family protein [unclassified Paenibacillus]NIK71568.1 GntR family transcriptional regulator of abcA and norABC [Paenibacillus sp. BK720]TCM96217.1 GntR family transcriptional regulator [Paenibacillus sp. BK033]
MKFETNWRPDRSRGIPIYRQIADYVRSKIESGEWPTGSRIPTERAAAKVFGVNRSTVVQAFAELAADGLIEGKSGSGTIVSAASAWDKQVPKLPDWESYVKTGVHRPNQRTIQDINHAEFIPDIIRLGTGEPSPDLFPKAMNRIFRQQPSQTDIFGYPEPRGLYSLREEISKHMTGYGISVSPDSVLIVSGALQALQLIALGLLKNGSSVLTESPSYLQSLQVFQSAGMSMWGLPLDEEGLDAIALERYAASGKGTLLYTIPSFHNPTGKVMSLKRRQDVYQLCVKHKLPILEDDAYRDLWLDKPSPPPLKSLDQNGLVLYIGSMSKTLSPGLRIGWVIGPEQVIHRLADVKMQSDYGASTLSQWTVMQFLRQGLYEEHLDQVRKELRSRRAYMLQLLESYLKEAAEWEVPTGGFYIWLRFKRDISVPALFDAAIKDGVLLNPGYLYDKADRNHLRLSYSYASFEQMKTGIERLARSIP